MNVAQLLCGGSFAGAEAVACALTRALAPHVDRSVLYLIQELRAGAGSCAQLVEHARRHQIELRLFETHSRFSPQLLRELRQAFAEDRIDVAHSHAYKAACYVGLARRLATHPRRTVFTMHGFDQTSARGRAFIQITSALGAGLSDGLIGVSSAISEHGRFFVGAPAAVTIPNVAGLRPHEDLATLRAGRPQHRARLAATLELDNELPWVAAIGRLVPIKNHALLLSAARDAIERGTPAQLLLIGDGPLRDELEQQARALGIERYLCLPGYLPDLSSVYRAVDVVALTSNSEGCPMVALEAMAHGLPLVASTVGGVPDLVADGRDGLLFAPRDVRACGAALQKLLADAALRETIGAAAFQKSERELTPEIWARRHLDVYRQQ